MSGSLWNISVRNGTEVLLSEYRKAVAAAVGSVVTLLSAAGLIDVVNPEVQAAIVTLLTVAAVYLVPNVKKLADPAPYEGSD